MAAVLSVSSSLEKLTLRFESPQSRPDLKSRRPPPLKCSVIPSLTRFIFEGVSEYLEDLVTCIDAPQLNKLLMTFLNQIDFYTPGLPQFIDRTPAFRARYGAHVQFRGSDVAVELTYRANESGYAASQTQISCSCREPDRHLSSVAQICNSSLPPISMVEDLYIERHGYKQLVWEYDDAVENTLCLELILPSVAVKNLYLTKVFVPGIAAALQELVRGRITEVLPNLQKIIVDTLEPSGCFQESIGEFVAARQLTGHSITISGWDRDLVRARSQEVNY